MPQLADIQLHLRHAIVNGKVAGVAPFLLGGRNPEKRLVVHQRNYETSLVTALLGKFPATVWLAGTPFVTEAARHFVRDHPPQAPCIAEYGEQFPQFLLACPGAQRVPYLGDFAKLEWHVGHVSIDVERPAVAREEFSRIDAGALTDALLALQPGMRYLEASWPVDELMKLYLEESAPDHFEFEPADVWLEVCGARGEFHINRLDAAEFMFRKAILEGQSMGDAAERALDAKATFDPGQALAALIAAELVTGITRNAEKKKT